MKDSMLIIRRGGTFLPTPGHVRVNMLFERIYQLLLFVLYLIVTVDNNLELCGIHVIQTTFACQTG